jgi:NADH dehydrogenase/NADH:ubiquinone oxidoreductase subunit G
MQNNCALADQRAHELEAILMAQRNRLNEWQGNYQMAVANKDIAAARVAKREAQAVAARGAYEHVLNHAKELREAALEFSGGVEVQPSDTANVIQHEMQKIDKRIEKERKRMREVSNEAPEVLLEQAKTNVARAEQQLASTVEQIKVVKKRLKNLKKSHRARRKLWYTFRGRMQTKTNNWFTYYMSRRQHGGSLSFDDENDKLVVKWCKSMNATQGDTQASTMDEETMITDTKALSGGERSYTTVSKRMYVCMYVFTFTLHLRVCLLVFVGRESEGWVVRRTLCARLGHDAMLL